MESFVIIETSSTYNTYSFSKLDMLVDMVLQQIEIEGSEQTVGS